LETDRCAGSDHKSPRVASHHRNPCQAVTTSSTTSACSSSFSSEYCNRQQRRRAETVQRQWKVRRYQKWMITIGGSMEKGMKSGDEQVN
ncbi:unnamed protein product, partial [Protopolystoma xenopodis]